MISLTVGRPEDDPSAKAHPLGRLSDTDNDEEKVPVMLVESQR